MEVTQQYIPQPILAHFTVMMDVHDFLKWLYRRCTTLGYNSANGMQHQRHTERLLVHSWRIFIPHFTINLMTCDSCCIYQDL
jgi:hypothetical protein